jgi:hypothetical protein
VDTIVERELFKFKLRTDVHRTDHWNDREVVSTYRCFFEHHPPKREAQSSDKTANSDISRTRLTGRTKISTNFAVTSILADHHLCNIEPNCLSVISRAQTKQNVETDRWKK